MHGDVPSLGSEDSTVTMHNFYFIVFYFIEVLVPNTAIQFTL